MTTSIDHNGQGVTIKTPVASKRTMDATIEKRKFHPLWVVLPAAIAGILGITVWLAAYFVRENGSQTQVNEPLRPGVPSSILSATPKN